MATAWLISPRFLNSKLAAGRLEDKIDVFEDRMEGWFLRHARAPCADEYGGRTSAGFAALTIVASYFEAIEAIAQVRKAATDHASSSSVGF